VTRVTGVRRQAHRAYVMLQSRLNLYMHAEGTLNTAYSMHDDTGPADTMRSYHMASRIYHRSRHMWVPHLRAWSLFLPSEEVGRRHTTFESNPLCHALPCNRLALFAKFRHHDFHNRASPNVSQFCHWFSADSSGHFWNTNTCRSKNGGSEIGRWL
jgi:hypothetical protein